MADKATGKTAEREAGADGSGGGARGMRLRCRAWALAGTAFSLAGVLSAGAAQEMPETWNIVSIVTDDQARWAVGAYGNREVYTPNMDRIAREGALFNNAFVSTPVCSPSRASFLTGLYGTRVGITDYLAGAEERAGVGLPPATVTWPEVLQQNGYTTALVGKWHLGGNPEFHPTRQGFSHFYGFLGGGNKPMNPTLEVEGKRVELKGPIPDLLADEAIRFLDSSSTGPFALLLHFREPHMAYTPVPEEDSRRYSGLDPTIPNARGIDREQVKGWTRDYYGSVTAADRNIGRVLEKLDSAGLTSRTIVVFTSDNGYMIGHHTLNTKGNASWIAGGVGGPKRPNMYEESIRIPLLVRWPGVVKPGTVLETPITSVDMFSTLLSMVGVKRPEQAAPDGRDLSEVLRRGDSATTSGYPVFGQYDLHNGALAYMRMIRTQDWKLVRHYFTNMRDELYDLRNDPGETRNLYDARKTAAVQADLQRQLVAWQKSINDPILERLPAGALEPSAASGTGEE